MSKKILGAGACACGVVTAWLLMKVKLSRPELGDGHWTRKQGSIVGHRGARIKTCPTGNTMSAFKSVLEHAVALELDVQITADDEIVVFHDLKTGQQLQGEDVAVMDTTLADMQSRVFSAEADSKEVVPTFKEVLSYSKSQNLKLLVELKGWSRSADLCKKTLDIIREQGYEEHVVIISFNPVYVYVMRQLCDIPTALIVGETLPTFLLKNIPVVNMFSSLLDKVYLHMAITPSLLPAFLGATTIAAEHTLFTPALVKAASEAGFTTDAWTVNKQSNATSLAAMGVNFITTDIPSIV
eukprot:TRINITY_DN3493_c0_g1_i3.p1 TRINITY_DN3493_c0_g1~~TRINITY_DN3493_c0_g1_i3.p1  ORF type:complete len:297 (+),score=52.95 TRINITY_DN3493_c0_g1_i3:126-1016(+)